jgi:hypothetical protein
MVVLQLPLPNNQGTFSYIETAVRFLPLAASPPFPQFTEMLGPAAPRRYGSAGRTERAAPAAYVAPGHAAGRGRPRSLNMCPRFPVQPPSFEEQAAPAVRQPSLITRRGPAPLNREQDEELGAVRRPDGVSGVADR